MLICMNAGTSGGHRANCLVGTFRPVVHIMPCVRDGATPCSFRGCSASARSREQQERILNERSKGTALSTASVGVQAPHKSGVRAVQGGWDNSGTRRAPLQESLVLSWTGGEWGLARANAHRGPVLGRLLGSVSNNTSKLVRVSYTTYGYMRPSVAYSPRSNGSFRSCQKRPDRAKRGLGLSLRVSTYTVMGCHALKRGRRSTERYAQRENSVLRHEELCSIVMP
ncbi:hypothetical protein C8Q78DRAFT_248503 [Trametes maxima]|nr:hypothetical protein C8Q78DRAFT_248503 [Trametes maxima]